MRGRIVALVAVASILLGGCALGWGIGGEPPAACRAYADEVNGTVVASFPSTVGMIREMRVAVNGSGLVDLAADQQATVCYVDGALPMAPPPNAAGNVQPSFNRTALVAVGTEAIPVALGYADRIPIQAP
jgi:hypothetical protein